MLKNSQFALILYSPGKFGYDTLQILAENFIRPL